MFRSTDNSTWYSRGTINSDCTGYCNLDFIDEGPFTPGATYYYHITANYKIGFIEGSQDFNFGHYSITPVVSRDWKYMTSPEYVQIASTPDNPDAYVWHEESNIMQGVHLNLIPGEPRLIVLEQNNHIINFTTRNASTSTASTNPLISYIYQK